MSVKKNDFSMCIIAVSLLSHKCHVSPPLELEWGVTEEQAYSESFLR